MVDRTNTACSLYIIRRIENATVYPFLLDITSLSKFMHVLTCVYRNTVFLFMLDCSSPATLQIIQWKLLPLHIKPCDPDQREPLKICQVKFPIQRGPKEARGEEEGRGDEGEESVTCTFRV